MTLRTRILPLFIAHIPKDVDRYGNRLHTATCESCYNDLPVCNSCNEIINNNEGVTTYDGNTVCESCYNDLPVCNSCNEIINNNEGVTTYDGNTVCESCYEDNYFTCESCGEIHHTDNSYNHNDSSYCESCYEDINQKNEGIHDYNYKPELNFYKGEKENTVFLGLELEVEGNTEIATDLLDEFDSYENHFYLKEDGSLSNGFEIVSHPHTLLKHKEYKWDNILMYLKNDDFTSYDNNRCGLHVHFNRGALAKTRDKQNTHILKLINFFYSNQRKITKLSQRTSDNIDQWCKFSNKKYKHIANYENENNRYMAINTKNWDTVEIRIFRGTLKKERFWACLEFVDAIVNFIKKQKSLSVYNEVITWQDFKNYVDQQNNYLNLQTQLKEI